ncbi:hypothetical protein JN535_12460 [Cellulosimicrobium cellulans]|uniref:DUF6752 domain-containing protein n=1 Tax=Cellulosimicrobium cellulans TaxID=1710 RepID=UPI00196613CE|nr:DUF6752 domain-containing protein [Cellulosimicrobium cellulans]MBN0040979.1 hypothetical protein [Cellulosimicrobium cellulans]
MKQHILRLGERIAPATMKRVRSTSKAQLAREINALRDDVRELRAEIDECRRDNIRIAELTEIVETRLAGGPPSA